MGTSIQTLVEICQSQTKKRMYVFFLGLCFMIIQGNKIDNLHSFMYGKIKQYIEIDFCMPLSELV